ncbi:MAG: acyltransferase [unclassified Hahellaceae]|nr:acyltransferase [Hahellaceae bacterium]|tara:strand:- start:36700 stop:37776 length:1077 start_codon:yes stop_codon:yes gene_type:complete
MRAVTPEERLQRNNFDLIRLLLAATVCLVHVWELSGFAALAWLGEIFSSRVAVSAFFVISGFLIFRSFERSASHKAYAIKRFRRIYPAYAFVIILSAVGLFFVSTVPAKTYFSLAWLEYLLANLVFLNFLQPDLPGVFNGNELTAVNGALWTLKIEVMFYMAVPVLIWLARRFGPFPVLLSGYVLSLLYTYALQNHGEQTGAEFYIRLAHQLPGQLSYFLAGAFFHYFLELFVRRVTVFVIPAVLVLVLDQFYLLPTLVPFALATLVIFFGLFCYVGDFGKYGDFSYGVYIVHFPIIQVLLASQIFAGQPWMLLLSVTILTAVSGILLWHLVEKRFLRRDSHYIAGSGGADIPRARPV